MKAVLGRTFSADEPMERPGGAPVAVISESLWRRRFEADPNVVGRHIRLNQQTLSIIGVAPASFLGTVNGLRFDLWVPLMMQSQLTGAWDWLSDGTRGRLP